MTREFNCMSTKASEKKTNKLKIFDNQKKQTFTDIYLEKNGIYIS